MNQHEVTHSSVNKLFKFQGFTVAAQNLHKLRDSNWTRVRTQICLPWLELLQNCSECTTAQTNKRDFFDFGNSYIRSRAISWCLWPAIAYALATTEWPTVDTGPEEIARKWKEHHLHGPSHPFPSRNWRSKASLSHAGRRLADRNSRHTNDQEQEVKHPPHLWPTWRWLPA